MPATPSAIPTGAKVAAASGKSGTTNRIIPYAPVFSSSPARTTLPAVGACVCASGSQVVQRHSRQLHREGHEEREHQQHPSAGERRAEQIERSRRSARPSRRRW